jgi:hypothetical protein
MKAPFPFNRPCDVRLGDHLSISLRAFVAKRPSKDLNKSRDIQGGGQPDLPNTHRSSIPKPRRIHLSDFALAAINFEKARISSRLVCSSIHTDCPLPNRNCSRSSPCREA